MPALCSRSARSTPATSTTWRSPGASSPTISACGRSSIWKPTPLVVNGVLYTTVGTRRDVAALDAASGELLWMHRVDEGARADKAPRKLSGHGVSYWSDGKGDDRIISCHRRLPVGGAGRPHGRAGAELGENGLVDLKLNDDQEIGPLNDDVGLHSTPLVCKDVVVIGAAHTVGTSPKHHANVMGYARGLRRAHRQAAVDLPHHPHEGRVRLRHLARRHRWRRQHRGLGPRSRPTRSWSWSICRSSCRRATYNGNYRRGAGPVRREHRRGGPAHRRAQVALSDGAPWPVGLRHPLRRRCWWTSR